MAVASNAGVEYDAFISYSHAADGRLAPALQAALQRFARRWNRVRALRVFRDDAALPVTSRLWSEIEAALAGSRFFVLLASPEAAASEWVQAEVAFWCEQRRQERLLIVLTGGELAWDGARGDFDWDRTTALPRTLEGAFSEEPRHLDLRWTADVDDLSLSHPEFRNRVAELAAPIHGLSKDQLVGEDIRQHRRLVRLRRAAIGSLAALTVLAIALAAVAVTQRNEARRTANLATSRQLAAEAGQRLRTDPALAALLSVAAERFADTAEARTTLEMVANRYRGAERLLAAHPSKIPNFPLDNDLVAVAFSPDGRRLATSAYDSTIVWDLARWRRLHALPFEHVGRASAATFSPNGRVLVIGAMWKEFRGAVNVWRLGRRVPGRIKESAEINSVAVRPVKRAVAWATTDGRVVLYHLDRGRLRLPGTSGYGVVAFSPDGRLLAAAGDSGRIRVWDVERRTVVRDMGTERSESAIDIAFSPDGRGLAVADGSGSYTICDLPPGGNCTPLKTPGGGLTRIAWSPGDGRVIAAGTKSGAVALWRARAEFDGSWVHAGWFHVANLRGHSQFVTDVAFSPDGRRLASASTDDRAIVWSMPALTPLDVERSVSTLAFDPRGRFLVSATGSPYPEDAPTIQLFDADRREPIGPPFGRGAVLAMAISPDGARLATITAEGWLELRRLPDGALVDRFSGHRVDAVDVTGDVAFTPDGRRLVGAAKNDDVVVYDLQRLDEPPLRLRGHTSRVVAVAASPQEGVLASAGLDREIRLWDIRDGGRSIGTLAGHTAEIDDIAFSPDGRTLASGGGEGDLRLWDVVRRRAIAALPADSLGVRRVAFSHDGSRLATSGYDDRTVLWDVARRSRITALTGELAGADALAFSPDDAELAIGSSFGLELRSLAPAAARGSLCAMIGRELTRSEWRTFLPDRSYEAVCAGD